MTEEQYEHQARDGRQQERVGKGAEQPRRRLRGHGHQRQPDRGAE